MTVVPSGIPAPAILLPTDTPVALATVSEVEAEELAEAVVATMGSAAILPELIVAKPAPASTVAKPPRMSPASLKEETTMPPVPMLEKTKSMAEPAVGRAIGPRLSVSAVAVLRVRVVREAPGSRFSPLNCCVLVVADLPTMSRVPPPSSSVLPELINDEGAVFSALKLSWSTPPRTMVLPE